MKHLRRANERGHATHGWLDTHHTFSFAQYHDPAHMGFHTLRVLNDDWIGGGGGFDMHPHRDMEIVTVVLEGALEHRDSMGHVSTLRPGDVQRMSAGTGVMHSECNASQDEALHLLQIWIHPRTRGIEPGYEEAHFERVHTPGPAQPLVTPDGAAGTLRIHQDARITAVHAAPGEAVTHPLAAGWGAWVHVYRGSFAYGDTVLQEGDAVGVELEAALPLIAGDTGGAALIFEFGPDRPAR
jgi:redox-sensitive bicupin YhaK (pirin superfamily)